MPAPRHSSGKTRVADKAATSKRDVALKNAELKAQASGKSKALKVLKNAEAALTKVQPKVEGQIAEAARLKAEIVALAKAPDPDKAEIEKRLKERQELEKNIARLGRYAVKLAEKTYSEVKIPGFDPAPPPRPQGGAAIFWTLAFYVALAAYFAKVRKESQNFK